MEKFMFIFHGDPAAAMQQSPEAMQENMALWLGWVNKLMTSGHYDSGEALLPGGKLISGADRMVTDGPYTEGKEVVGGYFIVKAKDMDEALSLTADYPDYASGGAIQVRPVMKIEM
jgi:hypothetical protein